MNINMNEEFKLPIAGSQCFLTIPSDVIERCESTFDVSNINYFSLLRATLAIRSFGGRYKRAFKALEEIGIPVPIVVYIVKKVCKLLNCGNLDTTIPHDDTVRAFDQFLIQQNPETYHTLQLNRTTYPNDAYSNNIPPQWSNPANVVEFIPGSSYNTINSPRSNYYNDQQEYTRKNVLSQRPNSAGSHRPNSAGNYRPNNGYARSSPYSSMSNTPRIQESSNPYLDNVEEYHNAHNNSYENQYIQPLMVDPPIANQIPLQSYNINLPHPITHIHSQILQLLLPEVEIDSLFQYNDNFYSNGDLSGRNQAYRAFIPDTSSISQLFWILSICIFLTVCDDRQPIEETLLRIEELCRFVGSGNNDLFTNSPVLGIALDVIVQRVVYELSDKVTVPGMNEELSEDGNTSKQSTNRRNSQSDILEKEVIEENIQTTVNKNSAMLHVSDEPIIENMKDFDIYSQPSNLYNIIHTNSVYAHELYKCISIMLYSVTESCLRIESTMLPPTTNSNSSITTGNNSPSTYEIDGYNLSNNINGNMSSNTIRMSQTYNTTTLPTYLPQTQTTLNSRTQKLSKQLREALAWSSCKDQLPLQSYQAILRMTSSNSSNSSDNNISSRSTLDPQLILNLKYKTADQIINNLIYTNSFLKTSDFIYHDVENMRNRLNSLFYHASTMPNLNDFQETVVEMGGIANTPLLVAYILNNQSVGNLSSRSYNSSYSNNAASPVNADVDYILNIPNLNGKIQQIKSQKFQLQQKLNVFQDILRIDTTIENCLKHIKACIKEVRNQMNVYCNDLQNYLLNIFRKSSSVNMNNPTLGNLSSRSNNYNNQMGGFYNLKNPNTNEYVLNPNEINIKITRIRIEMENICALGDKIIATMGNSLRSLRSNSSIYNIMGTPANNSPSSPLNNILDLSYHQRIHINDYEVLQKLSTLLLSRRYLIDEITKINDIEHNEYKRYLKFIEQILYEASFTNSKLIVQSKGSGFRIPNNANLIPNSNNLKYNYFIHVNNNGYVNNRIELNKLYNLYLLNDINGKIQLYLLSILQFAKIHQLSDGDNGTLNTDAWIILGLHVLLHYEIINNIHEVNVFDSNDKAMEISSTTYGVDYQFTGGNNFVATGSLSARSARSTGSHNNNKKTRLEEISLLRMLELFFRYMTEDFDILGSVITLRGKGEAVPKNSWRLDPPVMWRLSIEDPCDCAPENLTRPLDIGATLTRPGQIQVFKAIRRAAFGINAIVVKDIGETEKYVRMLFHKDDLLSLSRVSGYNGAAVITTPIYQPPSTKFSKVIISWTTELGVQFPQLLIQKLISTSTNKLGNRQNSIRQTSPRMNQTTAFEDSSIALLEGDYDDLSGSDDEDHPYTPRINNQTEIKKPHNVPTIPLGNLSNSGVNTSRSTNSLLTPNTPFGSTLSASTSNSFYNPKTLDLFNQQQLQQQQMQQQQMQQQQQIYLNQLKSNQNNMGLTSNMMPNYLNDPSMSQPEIMHSNQRYPNPSMGYNVNNNMKPLSSRSNYQPNSGRQAYPGNNMVNQTMPNYNEYGNDNSKALSPRGLLLNNSIGNYNRAHPQSSQIPLPMQHKQLNNHMYNQYSSSESQILSNQSNPSDIYGSNNAMFDHNRNISLTSNNNSVNAINRNQYQQRTQQSNSLDINNLFENLNIDSYHNNDLNYNIGLGNNANILSNINNDNIPEREPRINNWLGTNNASK